MHPNRKPRNHGKRDANHAPEEAARVARVGLGHCRLDDALAVPDGLDRTHDHLLPVLQQRRGSGKGVII